MNVSSVAGRHANAGAAVYNMTKFGVHAFSEALRQEALHAGIRVTTVAPGFVETELQGHNRPGGPAGDGAGRASRSARCSGRADIADAIVHAVTRPAHVCVNEVVVRPTRQRPLALQTTVRDNVRDGDASTDTRSATRLRTLREAMHLSLRDLAERSGVSAPMISQVERGETSPTLVGGRADRGRARAVACPSSCGSTRRDGVSVVRAAERRRGGGGRAPLRGPHAAAAGAARRGLAHALAPGPPPPAPATRRCTSRAAARPRS